MCGLFNPRWHPNIHQNYICIIPLDLVIIKFRFRHQYHHPACTSNEYIEDMGFCGGHFESQDYLQNIGKNYLFMLLLDSLITIM